MFDPDVLVNSTDEQLDALFRQSQTLGLDRFVNAGGHDVNLARHEIFNDAHWKGFLPKGLLLGEIAARLSTGYAKRFWMQKGRCLGETLYFEGRIKLKHLLEEVTLDRATNDLAPGRYIVLHYTDPVFEHLFYDVMKAVTDGIILYRGYSGRYPDGRRGWTAPLMRRYTFGQMGMEDHDAVLRLAQVPAPRELAGRWRMDVVGHANHVTGVAHLSFTPTRDGRVESRCDVSDEGRGLLPAIVSDHFTARNFAITRREARKVDDGLLIGKWVTDLRGPYAKLVRVGSLRLFQVEKDRQGRRRYALHYLLTRV